MLKSLSVAVVMLFSSMAFAQPAPEFIVTSVVPTVYQTPDDAMPVALANLQSDAQKICRQNAVYIGGVDKVQAIRVTRVVIRHGVFSLRVRAGFICEYF
jgi:hypothetical protein